MRHVVLWTNLDVKLRKHINPERINAADEHPLPQVKLPVVQFVLLIRLFTHIVREDPLIIHDPWVLNVFLNQLITILKLQHDLQFVSQGDSLPSRAAAWLYNPDVEIAISRVLWIRRSEILVVEDDSVEAVKVGCPPGWFSWAFLPGRLHFILDSELFLNVGSGVLQVVFVGWRHLAKPLQVLKSLWILHRVCGL